MKKRILAVLCVVVSLSLMACGKEEVKDAAVAEATESAEAEVAASEEDKIAAIEEQVEEAEAAVEEDIDASLVKAVGAVNGNIYENEYFGFGIDLGSDWVIQSSEQIMKNQQATTDMIGDDFKQYLESANYVIDFMATQNDINTVNLAIEKLTGISRLVSEEDYLDVSKDSLQGALESMGAEVVSIEDTTTQIGSETYSAILVTGSYSGIDIYEKLTVMKKGGFINCITVCTWQENTTDDVYADMYLL